MLIALVLMATAMGQSQSPATASCQLEAQLSAGVLEAVSLICPIDVPDASLLQIRADQIAARVPTPLVLAELGSLNQESPVFEHTGSGWQLKDATLLIRGRAQYPTMEPSLAVNVRCDLAVQLNENGRALSHQAVCEGREHRTEASADTVLFQPALMDAVQKSVWYTPLGPDQQCAKMHIWFARQSWRPDWMRDPVPDTPQC